MPHSEIHKKKLKKNLVLAGLIFLFCAMIWAVTMIKIAKADEYTPTEKATRIDQFTAHTQRPGNTDEMFGKQRGRHTTLMAKSQSKMDGQRGRHLDKHKTKHHRWWDAWISNGNYPK